MASIPDIGSEAQALASLDLQVVQLHGIRNGRCTCTKRGDCKSIGKHPRGSGRWQDRATTDRAAIEEAWAKHPISNVGVRLGPASNIVDIEFDDDEGQATSERLLGDIRTPTYRSKRSVHRIFTFPTDIEIPKAVVTVDGLEMRFGTEDKACQSVFPPSAHYSGSTYEWLPKLSIHDIEPLPFPDNLAELLDCNGDPLILECDDDNDLETHPGVSEGSRWETFTRLAGVYIARHGVADETLATFWQVASDWAQRCRPPYPQSEWTQHATGIVAKEKRKSEQQSTAQKSTRTQLSFRPLSSVETEPIEFAFGKRLVFGRLNVIAGDGGTGKTAMVCNIVSHLSTGTPLPGAEPLSCGSLIITAEDGVETLKSRTEAMGADGDRILVLGEDDYFDSFKQDIAATWKELEKHPDIRIVCFDTLPDFIGEGTDDHKNSGVRQACKQLIRMAQQLNLCVVGICHFSKGGETTSSKLLGSVAYRNLPRSILYVLPHPDDESLRVVWHEKHNLSAQATALAFALEADGPEDPPRVVWQPGTVIIDDVDKLLKVKRSSSKVDNAVAWLSALLSVGPRLSQDVTAAAASAGISGRTLDRAKEQLEVISKPLETRGPWFCWLPGIGPDPDAPIQI